MDRHHFETALKAIRAESPKRKFSQSIDLIINLKDLNLKQTDQQIDTFMELPHPNGRTMKVCALVGAELLPNAKEHCDLAILNDNFSQYDKKQQKKLGRDFDYFVAQANIMTEVAKVFGRVFGPKGKMPNPKAGCVVLPNGNTKALVEKLRKTIRLKVKTEMAVKSKVGTEKMSDKEIIDNCMAVYSHMIHTMPNEDNNVKNVLLKVTMGKPFKVGSTYEPSKSEVSA